MKRNNWHEERNAGGGTGSMGGNVGSMGGSGMSSGGPQGQGWGGMRRAVSQFDDGPQRMDYGERPPNPNNRRVRTTWLRIVSLGSIVPCLSLVLWWYRSLVCVTRLILTVGIHVIWGASNNPGQWSAAIIAFPARVCAIVLYSRKSYS